MPLLWKQLTLAWGRMHGEASLKVDMSYNEAHDGRLAMVKKIKFGSAIGCQGNIPHR